VRCIYGLEDLPAGEIFLDGERVLGPAYNLIPGHEQMQLVSQDFHVLENHSVEENIFDKLIGYTDDEKQKRAQTLLKLLELTSVRAMRTKNLSSGQKQRVAIARALTILPKVLLLDEPFSNLDNLLSEKLFSFITGEVRKKNTSVILVTHLAEEALKHGDRIAVVDAGKIVQSGEKWDVYYNPKSPRLAGLLGDYNIIKKEDLSKGSKALKQAKLFLRPSQLRKATEKKHDLEATVLNSTFNGKCFEILGETKTGNTIIAYSFSQMLTGKKTFFVIDK
jgi:iron(III) transport system ATP-binding protein